MFAPKPYAEFDAKMTKVQVIVGGMFWFMEGDTILFAVDKERIGDAPTQDVLEALYWAFYDGRRLGRDEGIRAAVKGKANA